PDCDKIVVSMTIVEIVTYGLPLDYFEHLIIDPDCQSETDINDITNFLKNHVGKITNSPF
ncbi:MAG: hypothetical protein P8H03_07505, partial [Emcibacteraceae bacterium]|nr:hypothetical protein [Emcibacteraceae bacterium]